MSGTVIQAACPMCHERHVTMACPTCGFTQVGLLRSRQAQRFGTVSQRRDAIAALMAEYAAEHPGATDTNTNMLDVMLWLSSRHEKPVQA